MDAFSRLKKNMAAQKSEASSLELKGKKKIPKNKEQVYLASIIQHRKERRTGVSEVAKGITRSAKEFRTKIVNSFVQNKKSQPKVLKDLPLKTICEIAEKCDHDLYAQCKSCFD